MVEHASTGGLAALGLNVKLFVAQMVNFSVVLFVLWRWVYRPLLKAMDERAGRIQMGLAEADQAKKTLAAVAMRESELMREASERARHVVAEARQKVELERQDAVRQTQADVERQLLEARQRLVVERAQAMREAREQLADVVVRVTEKLAIERADEKSERTAIQRALKELDRV